MTFYGIFEKKVYGVYSIVLFQWKHRKQVCFHSNIFSCWRSFFTWWNNLGDIQIPLHSESLEECILFGFRYFSVLNSYCILIAKFHIYCQRIDNNNAINIFQYLIELKNKLKIENYICGNQFYRIVWKISVFIWTIVKC